MFWRDNFSKRSQDLEEPIDIPRYLVQDIDTPEDFKRAELMYNALVKDKIIKK